MFLWFGLVFLFMMACGPVAARANQNITYDVVYQQSSARSIANMVNTLRSNGSWYWNESNSQKLSTGSLAGLTYDYRLEAAAMLRAAELAIYYDHTRPNGSDAVTCLSGTGTYSSYGENIAAGYESAAAVYNGWLEENEYYDGQGHRRNMLGSQYTAIGIGHVICNGKHYWAMELKSPVTSNNTATTAVDDKRSVTVEVSSAYIDRMEISAPAYEQMLIGESYKISPSLFIVGKAAHGWQGKVPVSASFSVSIVNDPSLMDVSGTTITARKEGTAQVKVTGSSSYGTLSVTFSVSIGKVDLAYAQISLSPKQYTWSGQAVCPKPVVTYHGRTLREGTDYNLVYARNNKVTRNTGGANVAAVGIGDFKGMIAESFEILAANITGLNPRLEQTEFVSDGMLKEPAVLIDGLTEGTDFRVEYSNNRSVGTGKARVTGIGNYTGEVILTFSIRSSNGAGTGSQGSGSSGSGYSNT
ncbi:MAG: CAP domain-containing protein, partial [Lachnospiraceae bacterium]|nr:CAP domain-containing protein [Lachnospiraceae bacterium]